ncbi:MAG TPA: hypothetical protein VMW27_27665 [Thermoanaerobaculia bacterium]|nr:hypothetical protein [Thermoanaerobaculia bacterium]
MSERSDEENLDPRAPLQAGDEEGNVEEHGGSDGGTGGQQDEGVPPQPRS